jgi:hypothetical protein
MPEFVIILIILTIALYLGRLGKKREIGFWKAFGLGLGSSLYSFNYVLSSPKLKKEKARIQKQLDIEEAISQLSNLMNQSKFSSIHNTSLSNSVEVIFNESIRSIVSLLNLPYTKNDVLMEIQKALSKIESLEIDILSDRNLVAEYYAQALSILGYDSSDGILNKWL